MNRRDGDARTRPSPVCDVPAICDRIVREMDRRPKAVLIPNRYVCTSQLEGSPQNWPKQAVL